MMLRSQSQLGRGISKAATCRDIPLRGMDWPTRKNLFLQDNPPLVLLQAFPEDTCYAAQKQLR
jgi:hypothetical protein